MFSALHFLKVQNELISFVKPAQKAFPGNLLLTTHLENMLARAVYPNMVCVKFRHHMASDDSESHIAAVMDVVFSFVLGAIQDQSDNDVSPIVSKSVIGDQQCVEEMFHIVLCL